MTTSSAGLHGRDASMLQQLVRARELAYALAHRELVVRYKRSVLGVVWALAEPLLVVVVYVTIFGVVLHANQGIANYALFTLSGLLPWMYLQSTLEQSGGTLLEHATLIRKVYFPRELLVLSVVLSRAATLVIGIALSLLFAAAQTIGGAEVAWERIWLLVPGLVAVVAIVVGTSLALAAVQVILRDTLFITRFVLRLAFYACPIVYPATLVPQQLRFFYELNPLVGILFCFQAFTDRGVPVPSSTGIASAVLLPTIVFFAGWLVFRRLEPTVSDLL
jgi:lipopolysaccharide transport system permease protein